MTPDLTDRAGIALDEYIQRVRANLRGSNLDAAEVVEDIRDHVAEATAGSGAAVDAEELVRILRDLGPPDRWGASDGEAANADAEIVSVGLDSPRNLAVAVFLVTLAGLATFPWAGPLGLLAGWVLARAALSHTRASGRPLGPWKWLVLPPLVLFSATVLIALVVAPIGPLAEIPLDLPRWAILTVGLGLWFGILALLGLVFRRPVRWLLFPRLTPEPGERR